MTWTNLFTICAINLGVLFLGYEIVQYYENIGAQHRIGECFLLKSFPAIVEILDIRDGKYEYRFSFLFVKIDKDDSISKFDEEIAKNFTQINCDTGNPI